jgi:magnesium-transporting ATPase (P-type)
VINVGVKNLLLRGCTLRNTDYVYGFIIYTGKEAKIMMNAKKPPTKVSNVMRMMNMMLYSVFMFQLLLILLFASLSMIWQANNVDLHFYLGESASPGFDTFFIRMLTFWVAYSHLIPISLYVVLEIIKLA